MHRDVVTHIIVTITDFLISGSQDGHIKFWKILTSDYIKQQQTAAAAIQSSKINEDQQEEANAISSLPIQFVKHFRAHLGKYFFSYSIRIWFLFSSKTKY